MRLNKNLLRTKHNLLLPYKLLSRLDIEDKQY